MPSEVIFVEDKHLYLVDGIPQVSVTQVIEAIGMIRKASDWHMERGSHIHKMIELYVNDNLDETTLDPQLVPRLDAYKQFEKASGFKVDGTEIPLSHPIWKYCGKPDIWGTFKDKNGLYLIDIKSGQHEEWHLIQIAAYAELLSVNNIQINGAYNLYLKDAGDCKLEPYNRTQLRQGLSVFLSAVTILNWKGNNL